MANAGALGSQYQNPANTTAKSDSALASAAALGGTSYLTQQYNNAQGQPLSSFSTAAANALGGGGINPEIGGLLGGIAGQLGQYGYAGAAAEGQMGETVAQEQLTNQEAQSTTGYDLGGLLLSAEGTGLQSQALAAQAGTAAQQQGIEQAQYGVQSGQYPEQLQEAALQNANAVKALQDTGASSGVLNTQGQQRRTATQGAEYGWQQADIYRAQALAQLGQASEQVGYGGQQEQFANQQQQLALAAQGEGLSRDQAEAQLSFGLQQAGVTGAQDLYGFLGQAAAAQGGAAQTYAGAIGTGSLLGGLGPGFGQNFTGG